MDDKRETFTKPSHEDNSERVSMFESKSKKNIPYGEPEHPPPRVDTGHSTGETEATEKERKDKTTYNFWKLPRKKKYMLMLNGIAFFIGGCGFSLMAPFFPKEAAKKGMSITLTSFVFSVFELMILVTSPIFGSYLTTLGPKFVFTSGAFVGGVCTILFGTLDKCPPGRSFIVISILCRAIGAIGFSANVTAVMAIISNELPQYVATCIALLATANGIGLMVGPAIGGVLYEVDGFGLPFYVIGGLVILGGALIYVVMPDPEDIPQEKKVSRRVLLRSPMVVIPLLSIATGSIGLSFLDPTLATHLEPLDLRVGVIGLFFAIPPLLFAICSPMLGFFSDKKEIYACPIIIGHFVFGFGFLFLGPSVVLPFLPFELWTVIVGLVLVGSSFGCCIIPTMKCMVIGAAELGCEKNIDTYAVLAGVLNSTYSCGAFLGPMVGGVLVQNLGYSAAYTVIGTLSIVMGGVNCIFFFSRYTNNSTNYNILT